VADHLKVPAELVKELAVCARLPYTPATEAQWQQRFAQRAAQWGADQELEACCDAIYLHEGRPLCGGTAEWLRAARRPSHKPPDTVEIDGFTYRLVK
jgi:hypothetical protein